MGTTPKLGLPYPEDPDTPNVPRDMKALAMAIDGTDLANDVIGGPYTSGGWWTLPYVTSWADIPKHPSAGAKPETTFTAPIGGMLLAFGIVNWHVQASQTLHCRFRIDMDGGGYLPFYGRGQATNPGGTSQVAATTLMSERNIAKNETVRCRLSYYYLGSRTAGKLMNVTDCRLHLVFIPGGISVQPPTDPNEGQESAATDATP